ncbi:hypothetical protein CU003_2617 [Enterococcus faecium]|nr:hypothetical protein [Enterococcus faecium]
MVWLLTSISYLHDFFVYFLMHFILQFSNSKKRKIPDLKI